MATAGPLGAVGMDEPVPALNLMGDFAGGSLPAVLGTVMALLARERTGRGQVVDAGMVDGAAYLMYAQFAELTRGLWHGRGTSVLSGVAPFYSVYRCADGGWMSVGSIESKFYAQLVKGLDLDEGFLARQHDRSTWAADKAAIAAVFASSPRAHWAALFAGTDACAYPVLELTEVARDVHMTERGSVHIDGTGAPVVAPAPRLSDTPARPGAKVPTTRSMQVAVLAERGISEAEISRIPGLGSPAPDRMIKPSSSTAGPAPSESSVGEAAFADPAGDVPQRGVQVFTLPAVVVVGALDDGELLVLCGTAAKMARGCSGGQASSAEFSRISTGTLIRLAASTASTCASSRLHCDSQLRVVVNLPSADGPSLTSRGSPR